MVSMVPEQGAQRMPRRADSSGAGGSTGLNVQDCNNRVPDYSGQVLLNADAQTADARYVGFTLSDHDSCAVELAVQVATAAQGTATVVTIGAPESVEQLRAALGVGCSAAVLVEADPVAMGPADVAKEIAAVVEAHRAEGRGHDLVLLGNDAADSGDFQVPVRLAYALGVPVVTGVKTVEVSGDTVIANGDAPDGGTERFEVPLPAVVSVLEGGVAPPYPTIKGRMAAKKVQVETRQPVSTPVGASRERLTLPPAAPANVRVLGEGPEAAAAAVDVLQELGVAR